MASERQRMMTNPQMQAGNMNFRNPMMVANKGGVGNRQMYVNTQHVNAAFS